jgi:hypothetical protein
MTHQAEAATGLCRMRDQFQAAAAGRGQLPQLE